MHYYSAQPMHLCSGVDRLRRRRREAASGHSKEIDHFGDDGAGQIARRGQLQAAAVGGAAEQEQGVACDCRSGDLDAGEVACKAKRTIVPRRVSSECIQARHIEQRPCWLYVAKPATHVGVMKEIPRHHCSAVSCHAGRGYQWPEPLVQF